MILLCMIDPLVQNVSLHFQKNALSRVYWNSEGTCNDNYYTVNVSPPVESGSVFTTSNTTIELLILYNQVYNISIVANNCARNSTPASISIFIGILHCIVRF